MSVRSLRHRRRFLVIMLDERRRGDFVGLSRRRDMTVMVAAELVEQVEVAAFDVAARLPPHACNAIVE